MGMISPVLKGTTQIFVRPTNPPPIPKRLRVTWMQVYKGMQAQDLDLSGVLKAASGAENEALVLEFQPPGKVAVYLEMIP